MSAHELVGAALIALGFGQVCLLGLILLERRRPAGASSPKGMEHSTMAESQDITDFCAGIKPAVTAFMQPQIDAAVANATANQTKQFNATMAQVVQDHADDVAALKKALADALTVPPVVDPNAGGAGQDGGDGTAEPVVDPNAQAQGQQSQAAVTE